MKLLLGQQQRRHHHRSCRRRRCSSSIHSSGVLLAAVATLLLACLVGVVEGSDNYRDCDKKTTDACPGDIRYRNGDHLDHLNQQADIWSRSGFYRVQVYQYDSKYLPENTARGPREWNRFPILGFVNITVKGTRYYSHAYLILENFIRRNESSAGYWEIYAHSNHERDGRALLLDERSQDPIDFPAGYRTPALTAFIEPAGKDTSIRHVSGGLPNPFLGPPSGVGDKRIAYSEVEKITCLDSKCNDMIFVEEYFSDSGERLGFSSGTYTKVTNETEWMTAIRKAYDEFKIPEKDRKPVPMQTCLVDAYCVEEAEWCDSGDPSCSESPYQEDTELLPGVIAGISILCFVLAVVGAWALWSYWNSAKERRYRTEFITRFSEDVSLLKPMKEITPENMSREFYFIDKDKKGYITKGEFADFMLSTKRDKTIRDADLSVLWSKMDMDRNGSVNYVEFCAFTADCYNEHSTLRQKLSIESKKEKEVHE